MREPGNRRPGTTTGTATDLLPVDAEAPFVLMIEITGFTGNGGGERSLGPADVTVRWQRS